MATESNSYDRVPYESFPFAETHPDRLAALAHLFGLQAPPVETCRVLELGCAGGGNLIPMALSMPQAEFVGVDLSAVQVEQGQQIIDDLGLNNIRLIAGSITDIDASFGHFDYILCHGVYSWVPDPVQDAILQVCGTQLSRNGVAYVSYNTLPGWRMRGMIRDLMRYHAMQFDDPAQRVAQARAILDFLAKWIPAENNAYGMMLQSELKGLKTAADYYILHEHLEEINQPIYFHEFADRAARHGLQYLAEANFSSMLASNFPPEVSQTLANIASDVIRQEQFIDFLRNRTFRQTLLVHDTQSVIRNVSPVRVLDLWISSSLMPAHAGADLASPGDALFQRADGGRVATPNAITKAALTLLSQHWPGRIAFADLLTSATDLLGASVRPSVNDALSPAEVLSSDLLQCFTAGLIEFHKTPAPFRIGLSEHPEASPLARWQARHGMRYVTTFRHEIAIVDAAAADLIQRVDGTRSVDDIQRALTQSRGTDLASPPTRAQLMAQLGNLGKTALLKA